MATRKGFGSPAVDTRDNIARGIRQLLQQSYDAAVAAKTIVELEGGLEQFPLIDHPEMRSHSWWRWSYGARSADGEFYLPLETFTSAITGQR